jgi:hypothetical protein
VLVGLVQGATGCSGVGGCGFKPLSSSQQLDQATHHFFMKINSIIKCQKYRIRNFMFNCPKCRQSWSSASFTCICGERILYIPEEIRDQAYQEYKTGGYDSVVKFINKHNEDIKIKSQERLDAVREGNELEQLKLQQNLQEEDAKNKRLVFLYALIGVVFLYVITPYAAKFVSLFVSCEIQVANFNFIEYIVFWVKFLIFVSLAIFVFYYFYAVLKAQSSGEINLNVDRGNRESWMKAGAVLNSLGQNSGIGSLARGAVAGAVAHHTVNSIKSSLVFFVVVIVPILLFLKFGTSMYCGESYFSSSQSKPGVSQSTSDGLSSNSGKMPDWEEDGHSIGCVWAKDVPGATFVMGKGVPQINLDVYDNNLGNKKIKTISGDGKFFWAVAKKGKLVKLKSMDTRSVVGWVPDTQLFYGALRNCN